MPTVVKTTPPLFPCSNVTTPPRFVALATQCAAMMSSPPSSPPSSAVPSPGPNNFWPDDPTDLLQSEIIWPDTTLFYSGTFPTQIGLCSNLEEMYVNEQRFSGEFTTRVVQRVPSSSPPGGRRRRHVAHVGAVGRWWRDQPSVTRPPFFVSVTVLRGRISTQLSYRPEHANVQGQYRRNWAWLRS